MTQERKPERVQKVLAAAGLGSRRACEELIAAGRVAVDGATVTLGAKVDPTSQVVTVDGERVATNPDLVHLLLNKPLGVVTTVTDPQGRPTVMGLVPANPRVYPVGRLDQDTEGLLIMTNDGELANRLAHPRYEVEKTYVAQVRGQLRRRAVRTLLEGVDLEDGPARARSVRELGSAADRTLVEIVLAEGRKREVRRMLAAVGIPVERLARVKLGPLPLGDISPGKYRPLTGAEVRDLYRAVGLGSPDAPQADGARGGAGDGGRVRP
ncbi:MAG TPA: pseudouridine synthase [Egibacteraceae bacterium]|nr:pseudouridine synthase [Egibacteraceae bacterium]